MNVADQLLSRGEPCAPALLCGEQTISYTQLRLLADRVAAALTRVGAGRGEPVGIWAENGAFFVAAYLAVIRGGGVAVPLNTDWDAGSLQNVLSDARISNVLCSRRGALKLRQRLSPNLARVIHEDEVDAVEDPPEAAAVDVDGAQELAALMFTSGSTGRPKGVMVTHRNIRANTEDIIQYLGLGASDRAMLVLPLHYCYGLSVLHTHLAVGGSVVINNQFLYPESVLKEMIQKQCTGFAGVPSTYQILLRKSRFKELDFPALRWLQQAGGKLPNPCIAEIRQAFPNVRFFIMYGQTEATARLSYLPPERLADKLGSIGMGLRSSCLRVIQKDGTPVRPGSDQVGEIVAQGDNISPGYWNDPGETARYFQDGWLHTGDLARVDEDGFIFIVDRERDMIKSGGNRVSAKEIEDIIAELADVVEVAVVGRAHELLGEAVCAFVTSVPGSDLSADAVQTHCRRRLPAFKVPEHVELLRSLPHNSQGKVLKRELMKRMAVAENS